MFIRKVQLFFVLLLAAASLASAQQAASIERGFAPDRVFQLGEIDHVNLLNGNVVVTLPIGMTYPVGGNFSYALKLVYNSKVWDYQTVWYNNENTVEALPDRLSNAGMGWTLSLGRLLEPDDPENDLMSWAYVGDDGGIHLFYSTLHAGDNEAATDPNDYTNYTRDGSFLRMRRLSISSREIDFPDGTIQAFQHVNGRWRITQIRDRLGNALNISYSADEKTWTLTDTSDPVNPRTHRVIFSQTSYPYYAKILERVELAAPSQYITPATYTFGYGLTTYNKPCSQTLPIHSTVYVPILLSVGLPDGSYFQMDYHSDVSSSTCEGPGAIKEITFPTLGKIAYDYGNYELPLDPCATWYVGNTHGVILRRFLDAAGNETGRWTYTQGGSAIIPGTETCNLAGDVHRPTWEESNTTVITPLKDKEVYYFSIYNRIEPTPSPNGFTVYDYGLPFTRFQTDATGTRFLSNQTFDCDAAGNNCVLKRSNYVRYERDQVQQYCATWDAFSDTCVNTNRRLASSRTVFHDFSQTFGYDELGNVTTLGYPQCTHADRTSDGAASPRNVTFQHTNGWLTKIPGFVDTTITYHANGLWNQVAHSNGVTDVQAIDASTGMARPFSLSTTGALTNWSSGTYRYDGAGNITKMGSSWFRYDKVSRLVSGTVYDGATGGGNAKQQTYTYDTYGNITQIATTVAGSTQTRMTPTAVATNRLTGAATYDEMGNLTTWNAATYKYDKLNQMWRMQNGTEEGIYLYTAAGERIWSFYPGLNRSRWTIRDLDGKVLREYDNNASVWSVAKDYVYRSGQLVASVAPGQQPLHFHVDHLGSPRLITNASKQQVAYHVYYPFGEEATAFNQDTERLKFTGHERDLASLAGAGDDLDYMHARFASPLTARFTSVDPLGGIPQIPQSWNRYAYVRNNPLRYIDPDGESAWDAVEGAANAIGSNFLLGKTRLQPRNEDFAFGQALGDGFSLVFGIVEGGVGGGLVLGGAGCIVTTLGTCTPAGAVGVVGGGVMVVHSGLMIQEAAKNLSQGISQMSSSSSSSGSGRMTYNQANREIERGQAPRGIKRVDRGRPDTGEQDHVHFDDDTVLLKDGTWRGGNARRLTNAQRSWLKKIGFEEDLQ